MKIASSTIDMASTQSSIQKEEQSEELTLWSGGRPSASSGPRSSRSRSAASPALSLWGGDRVSLSGKSPSSSSLSSLGLPDKAPRAGGAEDVESLEMGNSRLYLLKRLMESLTGHKIHITDMSELQAESSHTHATGGGASVQVAGTSQSAPVSEGEGWGVMYTRHSSYYEREETSFSASGLIQTADGRQIEFSLDLVMSHEFYTEENFSFMAGDALTTDPLVLNFEGKAAELSSMTFGFDLDVDGEEDEMSFVDPGSAFLALDRNGDGLINDGSELFGPQSGNGFLELAQFDEDGNNWIDENDAVFDRLALWSRDESGTDRLDTLKARGVGALYLGNVQSPFDLKDTANQLLGQVKSSGIYLQENGDVGALQQIDMVT